MWLPPAGFFCDSILALPRLALPCGWVLRSLLWARVNLCSEPGSVPPPLAAWVSTRAPDLTGPELVFLLRPVAEVLCSVMVPIDHFAGCDAEKRFCHLGWCYEAKATPVVNLAGGIPPVGANEGCGSRLHLVGDLQAELSKGSIRNSSAPHRPLHRRHIEVFDHDVRVCGNKPSGQLVPRILAYIHGPAAMLGRLGFRCPVSLGISYTPGHLPSSLAAGRKRGPKRRLMLKEVWKVDLGCPSHL